MTTSGIEIAYDASRAVRAALERVQRTEDVRFSPDNRRLVLAGFAHNSIAIVDVDIRAEGDRPQVTVTDVAELSSPLLQSPHGVDFLDDETILVGNRGGDLVAFRLPADDARQSVELTPLEPPPGLGFDLLDAPGSLCIARDADGDADGDADVLVCNNSGHTVTRHRLATGPDSVAVTGSDVVLRRWLDIPDGVAVSPDAEWVAVSNHLPQTVMLYRRTALDESSDPAGILRGASYPHGLRFSADGRHLFVADAGRPYVHVYAATAGTWQGVHYPATSLRVMDDDVFQRGRHNPQEGGPKGIDVDRRGQVLTVTSECQPLAFFDVTALVGRAQRRCPDPVLHLGYELDVLAHADHISTRLGEAAARVERAEALAYEAQMMAQQAEASAQQADARTADAERQVEEAEARAGWATARAEHADARAQAAEAQVAALEGTKTFRMTKALRRAYAVWLRTR